MSAYQTGKKSICNHLLFPAVYPSISDISAISHSGLNSSQQQVDETTDMTSTRFSDQFSAAGRRNTLAETKMGNTLLEADMTTSSADVFLDGCRVSVAPQIYMLFLCLMQHLCYACLLVSLLSISCSQ